MQHEFDQYQTPQTGEPSREDPWGFLDDHSPSCPFEDTLKQLESKVAVNAINVMEVKTSLELVNIYQRLIGWSSNPFLRRTGEKSSKTSQFIDSHKRVNKWSEISSVEFEQLLRDIKEEASFDSVGATFIIFSVLGDELFGRLRRAFYLNLEVDANRAGWSGWKQYVGEEPSEERRVKAKDDFEKFWKVSDSFLRKLVVTIQECLASSNEVVDVEKSLKKWRDTKSYFVGISSWEEVFDKERVLFLPLSSVVEWSSRSKHLKKLLCREEMGLSQSIIDSRLLDLEEAEEYDEWLQSLGKILRLAKVKGLTLPTGKEKEKYEKEKKVKDAPEQVKPSVPPPAQQRDSPAKPEYQQRTTNLWCSFCKRVGHLLVDCRAKSHAAKPSACFICNDPGHWAPQCPKRQNSVLPKEGQAPPSGTKVAPSPDPSKAIPTQAAPQNPSYQTSRYGRQYKPRVLHTINEEAQEDASSETEIQPPEAQSLHTLVKEKPVVEKSIQIPLPSVSVISDGFENLNFCGLLDTGSNLNYVSRKAFDIIQKATGVSEEESPGVCGVETMNGVESRIYKHSQLLVAIEDSGGERSAFRATPVLIHESHQIPGGFDFLLSTEWVLNQRLNIRGDQDGYEILLPKASFCDSSTMTGDDPIVLHSIPFDVCDIEEPHEEDAEVLAEIVSNLPRMAIKRGPLSEVELCGIKDRIHDPSLTLLIDEAQLEPPIVEYGFPAPLERQEKLFEVLRTLESQGIIREIPKGTSRFLSPAFGAKKAGGKGVRLVVDYTSLNSRLRFPRGIQYHSSRTWLGSLPSWGRWYSAMDVKDAFYRVDVCEKSRPFLNMSVWSPTGCSEFEWVKMPQGLACSPSYWIALIESTIKSLLSFVAASSQCNYLLANTCVLVYVDDVLVVGRDQESCVAMTDLVYQVLSFNRMYLPESKVQWTAGTVKLMGLQLSAGIIRLSDEIIEKVTNLRKPQSKQELQSALGLLNYVRWSLPTRSDPTSSKLCYLYSLIQKNCRFTWGKNQDEAWEELVNKFGQGLPLACFSLQPGAENYEEWTLVIQCDASTEYVGYCVFLVPKLPDDAMDNPGAVDVTSFEKLKLISVGNRRLSQAERLYTVHDREALGIFHALSTSRTLIYLFANAGGVILQTDNKTSLSRILKLDPDDTSTTRGRRWIRWMNDLSDILFCPLKGGRVGLVRFGHLSGEKNCLADFLSRYILHDFRKSETHTQTDSVCDGISLATSLTTTDTNPVLSESISSLLAKWDLDDHSEYIKKMSLRKIHAFLNGDFEGLTPSSRRIIEQICQRRFSLLPNGNLQFHNNSVPVIVVPNVNLPDGMPLRIYLIRYCHEDSALSCHRAEFATRSQLRRSFWWPSMDRDVSLWIASCVPCALRKSNQTSGTFNPRKLQAPNQLLLADWAGPFAPSAAAYQYVLLLVDAFSGYSIALPFRHKSAENTADGLLEWISLFGTPDRWSSDNDSTFIASTITNIRAMLGIKDEAVPSYSPSTQGAVERSVRTLKEGIDTIMLSQSSDDVPVDWPTLLKACVFNSNATERYGGVTPFEVMLGRKPVDTLTAAYGVVGDRDRSDTSTIGEYVLKLKEKLSEIQAYWRSKSMEIKNRASDLECDGFFNKLDQNDRCVRVTYISGRRLLLGQVVVVGKIGTNTYRVRCEDGEICDCHGYQLIKIYDHPARVFDVSKYRPTLDTDDEDYFVISKILEYHPERGYRVEWEGYSGSTWQRASDMPSAFRKGMKKARDRFHGLS
jgi:transposase InsO family protein